MAVTTTTTKKTRIVLAQIAAVMLLLVKMAMAGRREFGSTGISGWLRGTRVTGIHKRISEDTNNDSRVAIKQGIPPFLVGGR